MHQITATVTKMHPMAVALPPITDETDILLTHSQIACDRPTTKPELRTHPTITNLHSVDRAHSRLQVVFRHSSQLVQDVSHVRAARATVQRPLLS